jgi:hypothetical protein
MSPKEFKEKYNKEIIEGIKQKCQERNLIFKELDLYEKMSLGVHMRDTKVLTIENEVYTLFNNGETVYWDFIGFKRASNESK